ncbi:MAG: lytic transglycosylase domain-containing protein [Acidobacteria bacterium]|nr:lytic transglycosylase domain-containing protein [Acidobacteriota bacterium]
MQVSEKAAQDIGGGDRFDIGQNRAIGRAYLALLYRRYGNWPDVVSAYNWGMGNLDSWIRAGRPPQKLLRGVALYSHRVLAESGLCRSTAATHRDCIELVLRNSLPYTRAAYRSAAIAVSFDQLRIPGLEQSGHPLPRLASSGDPLPKVAQSGDPLPGLEQSGRPLSLTRNTRPRPGLHR